MGDDYMDDDEDYGFEYEDNSDSEPDVDMENQYYTAKGFRSDGKLDEAIKAFEKVLELEGEKGEWGFKSLKQMIKITFGQNRLEKMLEYYRELLTYIKSAVTKNYSEKSINAILDYISTSRQMDLLQHFYETTLEALKDAKNEPLWFKTNTKLGKLFFDLHEFGKLEKIVKQLKISCKNEQGEEDQRKGTQLLEIYALEIQMYTEQKNNKALKSVYELATQAIHTKSAIPHPLILGTIRECGGKMHMREGRFLDAHTDFFEAFKNYDESGSPRRTTCLKYLVLANMLIKSDINPFDSQEAKPFKNEPEIVAMTQMVQAYQDNDIQAFEQIMAAHQDSIMADPFIREHTEELMSNIRAQVLLRLIRPYTNVRISYLSQKLKVSESEVIHLLVDAILDHGLEAKSNEESGMIEMPKNKKKMTVSSLVVPNAGDQGAAKSDSKPGTSSDPSENFRAENRYKPSQHTPRELPKIREEKDDARSNASSRVSTRPASALSDKSNDVSGQFGFQSGGHAVERFTENFYSDENRAERLFPEADLIKKTYRSPVRDKQNSWEPSVCHYEKQSTPEVQNNSPGLIFANMSSRKALAVIQPQKNQESCRDTILFERQNVENVREDRSPEKSAFATSPLNSTKYKTKTSTPKRPGNTTRFGLRGLPSFECSTIYESPQRSSSPSRLFSCRQPPNPITPNTVGTTNSDTMLSNRTVNDSMIKGVLGGNKKAHDLISALEQVRKKRDQQPSKPDFSLSANQSKLNVKAPAIQPSVNTRNTSSKAQPSFHDTNTMQQPSSSQDLTNSNTAYSKSRLSTAKTDSTRSSRNRGGFSDSSVSTVVPNCISSSTSLNKGRDGSDSVSSVRTISRASSTMTIGGNCAQSVSLPKPIQISSKRLAFGVVPVNETLTMEIEIENISDRQCQVRSNLDSNTTAVRIVDNKSTVVDPKKSMKLRVSFTPNHRGRYQVLLSIRVPAQNFHRKIPIWGFGGVSNIVPTSPNIQKTPNSSEFALFSANMKRISFKLSNSEGDRDGFALMTVYDSSMKPVPNECITYRPARGVIVKKDSFKDVEIRIDTFMTDHQDDDYRASSAMSTASSISPVRRRVSVGADYVVEICWGEEVLRQRLRMLEFCTRRTHLIDGHDFTSRRFNGEDDARKLLEGHAKILTEDNDLFASSYRTLFISLFSSTRDLFAFRDIMRSSSNFSSGGDVTVTETTAFRHQTFVNDVSAETNKAAIVALLV